TIKCDISACVGESNMSMTFNSANAGPLSTGMAVKSTSSSQPDNFTVNPSPAVTWTGGTTPVAPSLTLCTPTSPPVNTAATCTFTLNNVLDSTGTVAVTVSTPSGAQVTACSNPSGGIACSGTPGSPITVTCTQSSCAPAATLSMTFNSANAGSLTTSMAVKLTSASQPSTFSVTPSP